MRGCIPQESPLPTAADSELMLSLYRADARSSAASRRRSSASSCGARCTARRTSASARRPSRRRRPPCSARTTSSPRPTAATATRWRWGVDPQALLAELIGRATGTCGGRARIDERHRPRPRVDRLLRHRRRLDRRRHRRRARAARHRPGRRRVLRRRRANQATSTSASTSRRSSSCRWCSSARTTSTASTRPGAGHRGRDHRARAEAFGIPARAGRRHGRAGVARGGARAIERARAGEGPGFLECRPTASSATRAATRALPQAGRARALAGARPAAPRPSAA